MVGPHSHTTMSGCTFRFTHSSPLRTTLVDEATGHAIYQIDTPRKIAGSITRIRKFDSPQPHSHRDEDADDDSDDSIADKKSKSKGNEEKGDETEAAPELAETSDEIARIYWKWFSPNTIHFQGRVTIRSEFLPQTGKLGGWVVSPSLDLLGKRLSLFQLGTPGATCSLGQTAFSTDGRWAQRG